MIRTDTGLWLVVPFEMNGTPRRGSMYFGHVGETVQAVAYEAEGRYLMGGCVVAAPALSPDQIERAVIASLGQHPKGDFEAMLPEFQELWMREPGSAVREIRAATGQTPHHLTGGYGSTNSEDPF